MLFAVPVKTDGFSSLYFFDSYLYLSNRIIVPFHSRVPDEIEHANGDPSVEPLSTSNTSKSANQDFLHGGAKAAQAVVEMLFAVQMGDDEQRDCSHSQ